MRALSRRFRFRMWLACHIPLARDRSHPNKCNDYMLIRYLFRLAAGRFGLGTVGGVCVLMLYDAKNVWIWLLIDASTDETY